MDTFTVKAIVTAAKYKSLSRAAEEFSYTPSAFSHILTTFEKELGVRIFNRRSIGVELTEEGKTLYPKLTALLKSEAALLRTASALADGSVGQLRIATYSSISRNLLSELLKRFKDAYPDVKLAVTVTDDPFSCLEDDLADILFADHAACAENEFCPIMEDEYLAVIPPSLSISGESISREMLYHYSHIYTDDAALTPYFDRSRFEDLLYFRSEDDLSVLRMVRSDIGIAVLPALSLKGNTDGLQLLPLNPPLRRTLGFAYRKDRLKTPLLSCFIQFLRAT